MLRIKSLYKCIWNVNVKLHLIVWRKKICIFNKKKKKKKDRIKEIESLSLQYWNPLYNLFATQWKIIVKIDKAIINKCILLRKEQSFSILQQYDSIKRFIYICINMY